MNISVLTPDKEVFVGTIQSVKVPGVNGEFQVLHNHAPVVSALNGGRVSMVTSSGNHRVFNDETGNVETVTDAGKEVTFSIEKGFIEVLNNNIALLVEGVKGIKK